MILKRVTFVEKDGVREEARALRDEADRLYAIWQLSVTNRGRLHEFMRAITRARSAADAFDRLSEDSATRYITISRDAAEHARQILRGAGAKL